MRKYPWLAYVLHDVPNINGLMDIAESVCTEVCDRMLNLDTVPEMHIAFLALYSKSATKVQIGFRTKDHSNMWIAYFEHVEGLGWTVCTDLDNMVSSYRCRIRDYIASKEA